MKKISMILAIMVSVAAVLYSAESVHLYLKVFDRNGKQIGRETLDQKKFKVRFPNLPEGELRIELQDDEHHILTIPADLDGDGRADLVIAPKDRNAGASSGRYHEWRWVSSRMSAPTEKPQVFTTESAARNGYNVKKAEGARSKEDVYVWKVRCIDGACEIEICSWSWGVTQSGFGK